MRINIEFPDEWEQKLDELAAKDGHSNRAAVVRKICQNFFSEKLPFVSQKKEKPHPDQMTKN